MAIVSGIRALNWRSLWLPLVCVVVIAAALIAVIVLSQELGSSDAPPEAPPFVPPAASTMVAQDVKQRDGATLSLIRHRGESAVESTFTVPEGMPVERLQPATIGDLAVGDSLNVIGVANDYNTFAVRYVVTITGATEGRDGFPASPAGFRGNEASRDPNERPQLGGVVERIEGNEVFVAGPNGPVRVRLEPDARFFRLEDVGVEGIVDGDRVAGAFDGTVTALLVMPGS